MLSKFGQKIDTLRRFLKKRGLRSEASLLWLLMKFAGYEDEWQQKIEDLARYNPRPFKHWFPDGDRIYLPFKRSEAEIEPAVEKALAGLGYSVTDYRGGYAEAGGRTMKIGKIIARAKRDVEKHYNGLIAQNPENSEALENEKRQQLKYWDDLNNVFINSPHRQQKEAEDMYVVISQDPHDLARMSYDRSWTSCMELGEGAYHTSVFCEVEKGGLVAYLIKGDDTEIEDPIARIHIRRFDSADGRSIAKAETSVYGEDIEGFQEVVDAWLKNMNSNYSPGRYTLVGGTYSDSYGSNLIITPDNEEELIQWFKKNVPDPIETTWTVRDNFFEELNDNMYFDGWDIWHEDDDGEKVFNNESEAQSFLNMLENMDYNDHWMDYVFGSWEQEQMREQIAEEVKDRREDELDREDYEDEDDFIEAYDQLQYEIEHEIDEKTEQAIDEKRDELRSERFEINRDDHDHTSAMVEAAADKILDNPSGFSSEIFDEMEKVINEAYKVNNWNNMTKKKFYRAFPERLTTELFLSMPNTMKQEVLSNQDSKISEEKEQQFRAAQKELILSQLDPENSDFRYRGGGRWGGPATSRDRANAVSYEVQRVIDDIGALDYISDDLFEPIYNFFNNEIKKVQHLDDTAISWLHQRLFSTITKKIDVENKKKLLRGMMEYYDENAWYRDPGVTLHNVGLDIASLGSEGAEFLPFLKKQLESVDERIFFNAEDYKVKMGWRNKKKLEAERNRQKRRLLYIIDAIENGTGRSDKYKWYVNKDY